jgi:hypothetical protein
MTVLLDEKYVKNNIYVCSPRATGSRLGWLQMSKALSRSILVESY